MVEASVASETDIVRHDPMGLALTVAEVALRNPRSR